MPIWRLRVIAAWQRLLGYETEGPFPVPGGVITLDVVLAINNAEAERWLAEQPGLRVVGTASTGLETVGLLRRQEPDALVCARASPNGGGLPDLAQLLAWLRGRKGLKVVVVIGRLDEEGAALAVQAGAIGARTLTCAEGEQVTADAVVAALREGSNPGGN